MGTPENPSRGHAEGSRRGFPSSGLQPKQQHLAVIVLPLNYCVKKRIQSQASASMKISTPPTRCCVWTSFSYFFFWGSQSSFPQHFQRDIQSPNFGVSLDSTLLLIVNHKELLVLYEKQSPNLAPLHYSHHFVLVHCSSSLK